MVLLRVLYFMAISMFFSLVCLYILLVIIFGRMPTNEEVQRQNEREKRLPEVKAFI